VPDFVRVDENLFVAYEALTGEQPQRAAKLALQVDVPGSYFLGVRKAMTAFRRARGQDSDVVVEILRRPPGHHRAANDRRAGL
jgi:hypothetical protein